MSKKMVPEVRFEGFKDEWQESRLNDVVNRITRKNESLTSRNPLTISAQDGLISQLKYYDWQVASKNLTNYYLLFNGDFAYNKSYSNGYPVGAVKRLENYSKGVLSTLYIVFRPEEIGSNLLKHYYESTYWYRSIYEIADEGARNHGLLNVKPIEFFNTKIKYPTDKTEQKKIGKQFEKIEKIITDKIVDLEKLKSFKQAMLQKMFPKEGEKVPEIRFEGFEGEWEKKHLSDLTSIVSGTGFAEEEQGGKGGTPFYKVSDMELNENKREMINSNNFVTDSQINKRGWKVIVDTPSIVIAKVGAALLKNRKRLVKKPFLIDNNMMSINLSKELDADFTLALFETLYLPKYAQTGALPSYNDSIIKKIIVRKPEMAEQKLIGNFFQALDQNIQAKQKELEKFKQFKKAMLQKMFV